MTLDPFARRRVIPFFDRVGMGRAMAIYSVRILGLRLRQSVNGIPCGLGHAMQRTCIRSTSQAMRSDSVRSSGSKMTYGHMHNCMYNVRAVIEKR